MRSQSSDDTFRNLRNYLPTLIKGEDCHDPASGERKKTKLVGRQRATVVESG